MQGNTRVGPTALYTAQAWRAGGFENAQLFDHPLGRAMYAASGLGQQLLRPLLPDYLKDFPRFLALRHHAIEARMERLVPDIVIEIAAGLSPRGLTYARRWPDVTYLELDLPNMVAAKRARLKQVKLPANYRLAAGDILARDFVECLPLQPGRQQRLLVITEGLMDYLNMQEKQQAWANVQRLLHMAAPGSRYLHECWPAERVLPDTAAGQLGLRGMNLLVGRPMDENLYPTAEAAAAALQAAGFSTVLRQDLHSLAEGLAVDMRVCPFVLFECAIAQ